MKNIATNDLNNAILRLQKKQSDELELLKEQFSNAYESVKPINLIKSTFQEIRRSPEIKNRIADSVLSFAAGYVIKRVVVGANASPGKKLIGGILQFAVSRIIAKNSNLIKAVGNVLLYQLLKPKKKVQTPDPQNENA